MKRRILPNLLAGAALLLAAACSDAVAPDATPRKAPQPSVPDLASYEAITMTFASSITIDPSGGEYTLGSFRLRVPENAVCDPATSGYGPEFWDAPCTRLGRSQRFNVQLRFQQGRAWIDFSPNVRFAPSEDPSNWVTLTARRYQTELWFAQATGRLDSYALLYAPEIGATPVDEGASDPSVVTRIDLGDGYITRRLKHFSGFTISLGFACDPSIEGSCGTGTVDVVPGNISNMKAP